MNERPNILHMMVGLPRSGKSTLSKQLGFPIVECDAIRKALGCFPFTPALEPEVWNIAHRMVEALFFAGHKDVILDSTNHTRRRRNDWVSPWWKRCFHVVNTAEEVCINRAIGTDQYYLIPVIQRMAAEKEPIAAYEMEVIYQGKQIL